MDYLGKKLVRSVVGGTFSLVGLWIANQINSDPQVLFGWCLYCAAVGFGANIAYGAGKASHNLSKK